MKFKHPILEKQLNRLKPRILALLLYFDYYCKQKFEKEITITSLIRLNNRKSTHFYGRAADIRVWDFTSEQLEQILEHINKSFPYGDNKHKTLIKHEDISSKDSAIHFHLQVK